MNEATKTAIYTPESGIVIKSRLPYETEREYTRDAYDWDDEPTLKASAFPLIIERKRAYLICAAFFVAGVIVQTICGWLG